MSCWNASSWSGHQWTAAEWEAWYAAINEAASVDLANGMGWAGPNPEAAADWSAGTAAVAEWSAGIAAVAEGPVANAAGAEQSAAAPDATPPDAGDAPANSRPQLPEQNDAPSQQVDAPTQEAQPPAVAEAQAGAAVEPATVATGATGATGAASSSAVAVRAKVAPAHLLLQATQVPPAGGKPPPALGQVPPAGGRALPVGKKAALPVKPAPVAANATPGPAKAQATAPPPGLVVAQAAAPSNRAVLDEAYFAAYTTFSDSCTQHNAAAKWLREYCTRNSILGVELPTHASVEVRDVVRDAHGSGFAFGEHKRQWHWHAPIAQLDAESLAKLWGGHGVGEMHVQNPRREE